MKSIVKAQERVKRGHKFWQADNGVWLTAAAGVIFAVVADMPLTATTRYLG